MFNDLLLSRFWLGAIHASIYDLFRLALLVVRHQPVVLRPHKSLLIQLDCLDTFAALLDEYMAFLDFRSILRIIATKT